LSALQTRLKTRILIPVWEGKKIVTAVVAIVLLSAGFLVFHKSGEKMPDSSNTNSPQASSSAESTASPSVATTSALPSGFKIEDVQVGNGAEVKRGDTVTINYKGTLTNGIKFDSSYDRGTPFTTQIGVGQVIKGWDLGVVGMKVGGKRRLTIPPDLAYGNRDIPGIPANSTLIFELELIAVK